MIQDELKKLLEYKVKVYIASGFFTDAQRTAVADLETTYRNLNYEVYSPREHTVDLKPGAPNRELKIKLILESNVKAISEADLIVCNLAQKDIGTLWELGFAVASNKEIELITADESQMEHVERLIKNLKLVGSKMIKAKTLLLTRANCSNWEATKELMNYQFTRVELSSELSGIESLDTSARITFLIDEHPEAIYVLMGYLYKKGIPYGTASFKKYGSNVMIAASSEGHIQLPAYSSGLENPNID